jgi:hypothetical protein
MADAMLKFSKRLVRTEHSEKLKYSKDTVVRRSFPSLSSCFCLVFPRSLFFWCLVCSLFFKRRLRPSLFFLPLSSASLCLVVSHTHIQHTHAHTRIHTRTHTHTHARTHTHTPWGLRSAAGREATPAALVLPTHRGGTAQVRRGHREVPPAVYSRPHPRGVPGATDERGCDRGERMRQRREDATEESRCDRGESARAHAFETRCCYESERDAALKRRVTLRGC